MFIPAMLVPYGGLGPNGRDLKPGETVIVAPATGSWGAAAVHLCLELGASSVIAMGRNASVLEQVREATGRPDRVHCVPLTDDWETDLASIKALGKRRIDVFFDISPHFAKDSRHFKAAIMALSRGVRVYLMSGAGGGVVSLPLSKIMTGDITIRGKWMFEPVDVRRFVRLLEEGTVRLSADREGGVKPFGSKCVKTFGLEEWSEAFDETEKLGSSGYVLFKP